jgi:hypothetical protein
VSSKKLWDTVSFAKGGEGGFGDTICTQGE